MTTATQRHRAEKRIPKRMFVRLSIPHSDKFEMAQTIDISPHGARIASKKSWHPNEHLFLRSIRGHFASYARVVHCQRLAEDSYALGLEFYNPVGDWTAHPTTATPSAHKRH